MGNLLSLPGRARRVLDEEGLGTLVEAAAHLGWSVPWLVYWHLRYDLALGPGWVAASSTERRIFEDLFRNLRPDDVFYDVGAHEGLFTLPIADYLGPEQVVAFEPGDGITTLREKADERTHIVEKAISQRTDRDYHSHPGRVGLLGDTDADSFETISGADICESDLPLPNVVKIDVFGAEVDVVESLEPVFERPDCRLVYLEVHLPTTFQRKRPDDIFDSFLEEWSLTDIVRVFYRCGFEVEPMYLRRDTHDVFLKAYRDPADAD